MGQGQGLRGFVITDHAADGFQFAMRWKVADRKRARVELDKCLATAAKRDTDRQGRELWRCSKRVGRGLRVVVDPRGDVPCVIWVGQGVPPDRYWMTPEDV